MGFERGAITALIRRPPLLLEALRTWLAMRRVGGIGMAGPYLAWRSLTAYGDISATISAQDVLHYLHWRKGMRSVRNGEWEA